MINSRELDYSISDVILGRDHYAPLWWVVSMKFISPIIPTVDDDLARQSIQRMVSKTIGDLRRSQFLRKKHQDHMFNEKMFNTFRLFEIDGTEYGFGHDDDGIVQLGKKDSNRFQELFFETIRGYGFNSTVVEESTEETPAFKFERHSKLEKTVKVHNYPSQTVQGLSFTRKDYFYKGRKKPKWVEWLVNYTVSELQFKSPALEESLDKLALQHPELYGLLESLKGEQK